MLSANQKGISDLSHNQIGLRAISTLLLLLPLFLIVLVIDRFVAGQYLIGSIVIAVIIAILIGRSRLKAETIKTTTMVLSLFFIAASTLVCSFGNGIHDIGIMVFPIIVGFSSTIINERGLAITSFLAIASIAWLVIGEMCGIIIPTTMQIDPISDFIITGTIVSMAGVLTYVLNRNIRLSLSQAQEEAERRSHASRKLKKELDEKDLLMAEVHRKATKTLGYISKLADAKFLSGKNAERDLGIRRKLLSIEVAHELPNTKSGFKSVFLQNYLLGILKKYAELYEINHLLNYKDGDFKISLDNAIYLGLCLIELLHRTSAFEKKTLELDVEIDDSCLSINIKGNFPRNHDSVSNQLIEIMSAQLKGEVRIEEKNGNTLQKLVVEIQSVALI